MAASRRRWGILAGLLALLVMLWLVVQPRGALVDVALVTRGPLEVSIDEAGETRAVNHTLVSAPTHGVLRPMIRDEGVAVAAGAVVAELEPVTLDPRARSEADARLARAHATRAAAAAQLRSADSLLADATRAAARATSLLRAGALSTRDEEAARLALAAAEDARGTRHAVVREAEAEVRAAQAALTEGGGTISVRAPVAGRVLAVHERDRRVVPAGTPLLTLGDVDAVEVRLEVLSRDALRIEPGQSMRLDFGAGLEAVPGEVLRVEPGGFAKLSPLGVEERRVRVIGRPTQAVAGVGDGYRVQAAVIVWSAPDVLQLPASAFTRDASGWAVFVVEGGRIRRQAITPGERGAQRWQVLDGVAPRTPVIRFPDSGIRDGERARIAADR